MGRGEGRKSLAGRLQCSEIIPFAAQLAWIRSWLANTCLQSAYHPGGDEGVRVRDVARLGANEQTSGGKNKQKRRRACGGDEGGQRLSLLVSAASASAAAANISMANGFDSA